MATNLKKSFTSFVKNPAFLSFLFGVVGVLVGIYISRFLPENDNQRVYNFYHDEMAVSVSPTTLKKWIDTKDESYVLVDLRSATEYAKEHFATAVNIPASSMKAEEIVAAFKDLPQGKEVVVHCYSAYCTLGRQIGKLLSENDIFVKELNIGWSELRYHWDMWNPGAKVTDGEKYIIKGTESSTSATPLPSPCVTGEFGC